jgi:hypothetical protein
VGNNRCPFNDKWTLQQAASASERRHAEVTLSHYECSCATELDATPVPPKPRSFDFKCRSNSLSKKTNSPIIVSDFGARSRRMTFFRPHFRNPCQRRKIRALLFFAGSAQLGQGAPFMLHLSRSSVRF